MAGADADRHPLLAAVQPLADALGVTILQPSEMGDGDLPLVWEDEVVGGYRLPDLHGALDRMLVNVERQLGAPLAAMGKEGKQEAVRLLDERGAFVMRKGVERVAQVLGVSRFTVYNYLNANEAPVGAMEDTP